MITSITEVHFTMEEVTEMLQDKVGLTDPSWVNQAITEYKDGVFILKMQVGDPSTGETIDYKFSQ
jgi:hypothetical protein